MFLTTASAEAPPESKDRSFDEIIGLLDAGGQALETSSGQLVTTSSAMQQATVRACVRIIAEVIAQLPIYMQRREMGRWVDLDAHPVLDLLAEPNEWQTTHELVSHWVMWSELRGNGYSLRGTDGRGRVRTLIPLRADAVKVEQGGDWALSYEVKEQNGFRAILDAGQVFHLRNFGSNGYAGESTIANLRNSIGLALRTEEHGARLFKHGAQPGRVIKAPSATKEQIEALQIQLRDKYEGASNAHRTMVLQGDMDIATVAMTQEDAQYLETRSFQKAEIAAAFGVPLFLLNDMKGSSNWGTGLEQQSRAFKQFSLGPRLVRLQQTLGRELLPASERMTTRILFDTDQLDLADFKARMEGYRAAIESGVLNPNEAREIEGRNPREGGDEYRQPMNIGTEGETDEDEGDNPAA